MGKVQWHYQKGKCQHFAVLFPHLANPEGNEQSENLTPSRSMCCLLLKHLGWYENPGLLVWCLRLLAFVNASLLALQTDWLFF